MGTVASRLHRPGLAWILALAAGAAACSEPAPKEAPPMTQASEAPRPAPEPDAPAPATEALATFGGGCFWCTEAVFRELRGVLGVASGYAGGHASAPTYRQVCDGSTGHAEVIQVRYDPSRVRYEELLEVFFATHDPTTPNRQGADVGTQYRSIVLAHDDAQRRAAERIVAALDASGAYDAPVVTQVVPLERFWKAEEYHQGYFARNPEQGYCAAVIRPKLEKFRKVFAERLAERP
jgi:peptide-methionine (S)-S-oxide reductase